MGCFPTACLGHWKHGKTMKKVHDQPFSPSHELREAVTLLGATAETIKEEEIIVNPKRHPHLKFHQNLLKGPTEEEQMNCKFVGNENIGKFGEKRKADDSSTRIRHAVDDENREEGRGVSSKGVTFLDGNSNGKDIVGCVTPKEESSESLFSISIDSRKRGYDAGDREVNSPLKPIDVNRGNTTSCAPLQNQSPKPKTRDDETNSLRCWLNASSDKNFAAEVNETFSPSCNGDGLRHSGQLLSPSLLPLQIDI